MVAGSASPLPAGAGAVETAMVIALTTAGAGTASALAAVLTYRLISIGSTAAVGWVLVAQARPRPRRAVHAVVSRRVDAASRV